MDCPPLYQCSKCDSRKPIDEFPPSKVRNKAQWCRQCLREDARRAKNLKAYEHRVTCAWCHHEFETTFTKAQFCSRKCKDDAGHEGARHARIEAAPDRQCVACGADITKMRRRDSIYCSAACREMQRRRDGRVTKADERRRSLKRYHQLTPEAYEQMVVDQGGRCAICLTDDPGTQHGYWHIDHDHACCPGRSRGCGDCVRGLLCGSCNLGLGHFADDPVRLQSAIDYLRRFTDD